MLDDDLAELCQVETRRLNEQVKRNIDRFPEDFMFQLTEAELENLKSQNATSSWGGRRKIPFAFTEHGVLMSSSVLNSDQKSNKTRSGYQSCVWVFERITEPTNRTHAQDRIQNQTEQISPSSSIQFSLNFSLCSLLAIAMSSESSSDSFNS